MSKFIAYSILDNTGLVVRSGHCLKEFRKDLAKAGETLVEGEAKPPRRFRRLAGTFIEVPLVKPKN